MLNENQILAINHKTGPCLTLAGPGSGKTTVLVERILALIRAGVEPAQILVITFTKDAAGEMKARFLDKAGAHFDVTFGTFHSVFYNILKNEKYRDYELLNGRDKLALIKDCCRIMDIKLDSTDLVMRLEKDISYYQNTGKISGESVGVLSEEEFSKLMRLFSRRKKEQHCLDFDDMLIKTGELFDSDRGALERWQKRYSYFLVDEFQDINGVQFDVLKKLVLNHPSGCSNIFGVGDDDQSIYGFRGSSPSYMMEFPKVFKDCKTILLDRNYRSAPEVCEASKRLINCNKDRFFKDYIAESKTAGRVEVLRYEDNTKEAKDIAERIVSKSGEEGYGDIAVLYRKRSQAAAVYSLLRHSGVEVYSDEVIKELTDTGLAQDMFSYLRLAQGPLLREDLVRILNKPSRDLKKGGLLEEIVNPDEWISYYPKGSAARGRIEKLLGQIRMLGQFSPYTAVNFIKKGMGYDEYIRRCTYKNPTEQEELLSLSDSFLSYAGEFSTIKELLNRGLEKKEEKKVKRGDQKVCMYTFHGSKGLEFDTVFILDANEGISPSLSEVSKEAIEEERRMFYVAMTRAKTNLFIGCIEKLGDNNMRPSRFLTDMGYEGIWEEA